MYIMKKFCEINFYFNGLDFRDRFVLLENGYGQMIGRKKNTIIRGGENIEPREIEDFLLTQPEIANVQVTNKRTRQTKYSR